MKIRESILLKAKDDLLQQALDDNRYLEAALQKIINPIKFMQEEAKRDGMLLDGHMAVKLYDNPNYLKQIAKEALARLPKGEGARETHAILQLNVGWKAGVDSAIHEISQGRTITNFGHVPEVVRALEWVIMDLQGLKPPKGE